MFSKLFFPTFVGVGADGVSSLHDKRTGVGGLVGIVNHDSIPLPGGVCSSLRSYRLHRQYSLSRLWQLGSGLCMRVEHGKVGHDDGHRQSDGEYSSEGAYGADEHSHVRFGSHVAIAHCCHGHNGPPQTHRDGFEVIFRIHLRGSLYPRI